jgi:hypothetical protein
MIAFVKEHRDICGVEPICWVLQISPSTFYAHLAVARDRDLASERAKRDAELVLSHFSSGLFRAMFAMMEIWNCNEIHRQVSA